MNIFSRSEKRYYSDEIDHGLGKGPVFVVVGLEQFHKPNPKQVNENNDVIFMGDHEVFKDSPYEGDYTGISIGSAIYPGKGTFRIGVTVPDGIDAGKLRLRWWAYKKEAIALASVNESKTTAADPALGETASGKEQ